VAANGASSAAPTTSNSASGGSAVQKALAYASCMRSHGVTNFPDPNANGGFMIGANNGLNPGSPQYQHAQQACQKYLPGAGGGGTFTSGPGGGA
jgi:hypothetical protein